MAAGIARYRLAPLTHMESAAAYDLELWEADTLAQTPAAALELAALILKSTAVHQPGIGIWASGKDARLPDRALPSRISRAGESDPRSMERRFRHRAACRFGQALEPVFGHHHYAEFFTSLDPGVHPHPYCGFLGAHDRAGDVYAELKAAIAFSCRASGTRHARRLPRTHQPPPAGRKPLHVGFEELRRDDAERYLLDYDANWLAGPRPPNFKWFHAQLLTERRDAQAVVPAHDLLGRVYALGKRKLVPAFRTGLDIAMRPLPAYPRCDLVVDADVRRKTLDALGLGRSCTRSRTAPISSQPRSNKRPSTRSNAKRFSACITSRSASAGPNL